MSESKSKVMSFRLSAQLEALANDAAAAAGDKNASAWCQRLVIETLSKMSAPNRHEVAEPACQSTSADRLLEAVGNLRQLNLDCFKMSLKSENQYKEFLNVVIANEEEWEAITQNISQTTIHTLPPARETHLTDESSGDSANPSGRENSADDQIAAKISSDYLSFAEELENDIAELVGGEREAANLPDDQSTEFNATVLRNQLPPIAVPILTATEQADAGTRF